MQPAPKTRKSAKRFGIPWMVGFCLFAAIALFFLWEEHEAHILGAFPFVLLLLCPVIHLLMHRGHGRGDQAEKHHTHPTGGAP